MTKTFPLLLLAAALGLPALHGVCAAQASVDGAVPAPVLSPARRVAHAGQAMVLASTRAGKRLVAVGDHGVVMLSDDGGRTQRQAKSVPVDVSLTSASFVDDKNGWAAGHAGVILHTSDGGETWTTQRSDLREDRPIFGIHFFDAMHGVAVGLWSLVLTTSDGGVHWQAAEMPVPDGARKADLNMLGLFADRQGRVFAAAEKGMVMRSDDRGHHWTYLSTGYKGSFWTGIATAEGALVVAGLRGSLYRSVDDGATWQRIDTHSKSSITALAASGAEVVGVGLDGLVLRSSDGGASFTPQVRPDRLSLTSVTFDDRQGPVMFSRQGLVKAESPGKP